MPTDLGLIDTIVILMMENRSFDHMLGYLSLLDMATGKCRRLTDCETIRRGSTKLRIQWNGAKYLAGSYDASRSIPDPPHERANIATQLGARDGHGNFALDGFITSASGDSDVMNYQTPDQVPMLDFFAKNFADL